LVKPYTESSIRKEITVGIYYDSSLREVKQSMNSNAY
jgi:hypothetical protein